ncbi:unnamed protein product [Hymenolepis diminuta]|uniref:MARVEL domain-containing protein n=1 Tax=Hymenolepis diminuta TaxID=6216 RepID=A0A0R3SK00_HYMDI|nr:unnamed protein product [Hymenolepis diminuta]
METEKIERKNKFKTNTFIGINTYVMVCGLGWIILGAIVTNVTPEAMGFGIEGILLGILYITLAIGGFLIAVKNGKIYYRVYCGFLVVLITWEMVNAILIMTENLLYGFLMAFLAATKIVGAVLGFQLANAIHS